MPSYGVAVSMLIEERIEKAIEKNFSSEVKGDARKILSLSRKGSDFMMIFMLAIAGIAITTAQFLSGWIIGGIVAGAASALIITLLIRSQIRARKELNKLIQSNRSYWEPICNKLKQIILEAGSLEDPFLGRIQKSRVVE